MLAKVEAVNRIICVHIYTFFIYFFCCLALVKVERINRIGCIHMYTSFLKFPFFYS